MHARNKHSLNIKIRFEVNQYIIRKKKSKNVTYSTYKSGCLESESKIVPQSTHIILKQKLLLR